MDRREIYKIVKKEYPDWSIAPKPLGNGSYGVVFKMTSREDGEIRALKVVAIPHDETEIDRRRQSGISDSVISRDYEAIKDRVLDEIINVIQLRANSNVIHIFGYREIRCKKHIGWLVCFDMEYLHSLDERSRLSETEIIRVGQDISNALLSCHEKNIIHRDIKPDNILRKNGAFVLADFGESKFVTKQSGLSVRGTYDYMAPEVIKRQLVSSIGAETIDIYSLGITLYLYANDNRLPFVKSERDMLYAETRDDANTRRWNGESIPCPSAVTERLASIILCACQSDPHKRYDSIKDMKYDLDRVNTGEALLCFDKNIDSQTTNIYESPVPACGISANQSVENRGTVNVFLSGGIKDIATHEEPNILQSSSSASTHQEMSALIEDNKNNSSENYNAVISAKEIVIDSPNQNDEGDSQEASKTHRMRWILILAGVVLLFLSVFFLISTLKKSKKTSFDNTAELYQPTIDHYYQTFFSREPTEKESRWSDQLIRENYGDIRPWVKELVSESEFKKQNLTDLHYVMTLESALFWYQPNENDGIVQNGVSYLSNHTRTDYLNTLLDDKERCNMIVPNIEVGFSDNNSLSFENVDQIGEKNTFEIDDKLYLAFYCDSPTQTYYFFHVFIYDMNNKETEIINMDSRSFYYDEDTDSWFYYIEQDEVVKIPLYTYEPGTYRLVIRVEPYGDIAYDREFVVK